MNDAGWHGRLALHYTRDADGRTVAHDRHDGPLRVLQRLYPEGPGICHHVLVHPPGGVAGGDVLQVQARLDAGTHALVTTPGATRFYRSAGRPALQRAELLLQGNARLEWLPLEAIAYDGCIAENQVSFTLEAESQLIGWDLLALGLPAADAPFARGQFLQQLEWPGHWLERGLLRADDQLLRNSPLGLAGHEVMATLWFASGSAWGEALAQGLLEDARAECEASPLARSAGATQPQPGLVLLRVLAARVEPAMALLQAVRGRWRERAWGLPAVAPRIWRS
jgi:urease accessory protein